MSEGNNVSAWRRQRRDLSCWLAEWKLDLALRDEGVAGGTTVYRAQGQPGPSVGDIRLLPPAPLSVPALERPVYVAVLRVAGAGEWEVAPFSRFPHPATPGEWRTGLRAAPLRVLSLWNLRAVSTQAISGTWRTGSMSEAGIKVALERSDWAARHGEAGTIPAASGTGPPLLHPLDPRVIYLAEERLLLDDLLQGSRRSAVLETLAYAIPEPDQRLLLAAEQRASFAPRDPVAPDPAE